MVGNCKHILLHEAAAAVSVIPAFGKFIENVRVQVAPISIADPGADGDVIDSIVQIYKAKQEFLGLRNDGMRLSKIAREVEFHHHLGKQYPNAR